MPSTGLPMPSGCGVHQHERDSRPRAAAVGPGVIGAALDHDIAGLQLDRRIVHVHFDLALDDDDVVHRLGAVHVRMIAGREVDHAKPRAVWRRRRADNARTQVLDFFARRDVGRILVGDPHQRGPHPGIRVLDVGRRCIDQDLGDVVVVVPGHHSTDWRSVRLGVGHGVSLWFRNGNYAAGRATLTIPLRSPARKQRMFCSRIGMARST